MWCGRGVWTIGDEAELAVCYDATFDEVFRYAAQLTGDHARAEDLVSEADLNLIRAALAGDVSAVGIGWLVVAVRRRFIDELRFASREERRLRLIERIDTAPAADDRQSTGGLLAALSDRERLATVVRHVEARRTPRSGHACERSSSRPGRPVLRR